MMPDPDGGMPGFMKAFFVLFGIVFVTIVLVGIVRTSRSYRTLKDAGIDPLAAEATLAARAMNSQLLAPEPSLTDRIAELDRLKGEGKLSEDEYAALRKKTLGL